MEQPSRANISTATAATASSNTRPSGPWPTTDLTAKISDDGDVQDHQRPRQRPGRWLLSTPCAKSQGLPSTWWTTANTPWATAPTRRPSPIWNCALADGSTLFGVGIDKNIVVASLKAVVSGVNRALKR